MYAYKKKIHIFIKLIPFQFHIRAKMYLHFDSQLKQIHLFIHMY